VDLLKISDIKIGRKETSGVTICYLMG